MLRFTPSSIAPSMLLCRRALPPQSQRAFSLRSPEIKTGKRCNCSLCIRRGAVLSRTYIPAADFTPHHDLRDLGVYRWNEKLLSNCFCKSCGIFKYIGDGENAKDGYRVNLGCVEDLDPLALEIIIDGKALPVIEEPAKKVSYSL